MIAIIGKKVVDIFISVVIGIVLDAVADKVKK